MSEDRGTSQRRASDRRGGVPVSALFLIALGVLLLLQTTGTVHWEIWLNLWRFWPVILISAGVNLLLGRRAPWVAALAVAGLLAASVGGSIAMTTVDFDPIYTILYEPLGDLRSVDVKIGFGAGEMTVGSLPPDSERLVEGRFDTPGRGAKADMDRHGDSADLRISMEEQSWFHWFGRSGADWEILLAQRPDLRLDLDVGAAEVGLDLRDLKVTELEIDAGATDLKITMPADAGHVDARIDVGAASVDVIVPDGVAARISKSAGLSSFEVDTRRFPEVDGEYVSPGFESAVNRLTLDIRAGASSVNVR